MKEFKQDIDYSKLTLVQLSHRIVVKSDEIALREILERRRFFQNPKRSNLIFWDFIYFLYLRLAYSDEKLAEKTLDLLIERFINLPGSSLEIERRGPDCRNQYKLFLNKFPELINKDIKEITLDHLRVQEQEFQRLVYRHFIWA